METKIIKAVFGGGRYAVTNKRTRTDYGQVLEFVGVDLPDTFECIFSNSATSAGTGKKMIGSNQRCPIPDEYLATGQTIYAWILLHDTEDDGRHMYSVRIPVADMPDLSPEEPTPVEQSVISQAITALNSAVDTTTQKAQEATESADRAEHAAEGAEGYAERAESAQQAAESARDRATQAETSARTSAATATEKASEAISSATTASQSALTAENASESASASADASAQSALRASQFAVDASVRAHNASEYAQEASVYASNSSTSAQTASQKASEAAQSASTAVQAKTDAETAKTASETAQGLAEQAQTAAETAQGAAEDARDEAQDIVDGITGKVEQIDSNTERIESLEDDRYKPYAVDTASGAVASFADGADDIPLKSCIVQIEPVQDLHGYDHPWPAGGGKNILPPRGDFEGSGIKIVWGDDGKVTFSGTAEDNTTVTIPFTLSAGTTITFSLHNPSAIGSGIRFMLIGGDEKQIYLSGANTSITWTPTADVTSARFRISNGSTISGYGYPQIELGSTATDFAPYENICPISGWTGCEVKHSGADTSNPTTYPITFPTEVGTVYGGYIDPINGELVTCPYYASYNGETLTGEWISDRDKYVAGTTPTIGAQVVNIGAVGETYPLTPTDIRTLLGTNNVWADTGDVSVEYRADVKLYINKKIAEAISALS